MKKSLIALAAVAASGAAMAQSSVTLFGVVDTGVTYVSGPKSWTGMTSGNNATSRIGFRGTEDLGGGLKANFWLEAGLNSDAGDGFSGGAAGSGLEFKRRATVGLEGAFGEVRMGRELTAAYLAVSRYDVFGDVGLGGSRVFKSNTTNASNEIRKNNMLTYVTPNFSGFKASVNYAFGEGSQGAGKGAYFGTGLTYDNGPLSIGFSAERQNNTIDAYGPAPTLAGTSAADLATYNTALTAYNTALRGSANGAAANVRNTAYGIGGSYNFGVVKLGGLYRQARLAAPGVASVKNTGMLLAISAPVGAAGEVKASYARYENGRIGASKLKADHFSVGYVHSLSKRTAVYSTYSYLKNKNNNGSYMGLSLGGNGPKSNGKQHGIQVGVRHSF